MTALSNSSLLTVQRETSSSFNGQMHAVTIGSFGIIITYDASDQSAYSLIPA